MPVSNTAGISILVDILARFVENAPFLLTQALIPFATDLVEDLIDELLSNGRKTWLLLIVEFVEVCVVNFRVAVHEALIVHRGEPARAAESCPPIAERNGPAFDEHDEESHPCAAEVGKVCNTIRRAVDAKKELEPDVAEDKIFCPDGKKEIEIDPKDAFGERDPKLVRIVPKKTFRDQKFDPAPGMIVDFGGMKGRIQSADAGRVRVDFNSPLAGHKLRYSVEIKERIENPAEQVRAILDFFGARDADVRIEGASAIINFRLPLELKERVSSLVLQHVKGVEKVNFVESFGKKRTQILHRLLALTEPDEKMAMRLPALRQRSSAGGTSA